jgi:hypothetical protein
MNEHHREKAKKRPQLRTPSSKTRTKRRTKRRRIKEKTGAAE